MFSIIILIILLLAWLLWLPYVKSTTKHGAPFVPMEADVVNRILDLTGVGEKDTFFDLGSGDGRLVTAAAARGAKAAIGIEIDQVKVFYSRLWIKVLRLKNAHIINANLFGQNLSDATIVVTYLLPDTHQKLKKKLEKELKPGTKVVAVAFEIPGWTPERVDPRGTRYGPIYLYITNPKKP